MVIKRTTTIVTTTKPIVNGQVATTIRTETRVSFVSVPTSNSCIAALEAIPTDFECTVYDQEVYLSPGSVTDLIALPSLTSSLPTECLIQIFLACHSKSEDSDYDEHHGDGNNPKPLKSASKRAFRMNLTLLALDRTTRAILTNTPILWRNTIETWSFPMLRTVAPVLVPGCFDKITDLSPDVDDPVQLPETVAALLTKCHNLEAVFLYFLSLDIRILLNLVKAGPPLKLKNLVFVDLDVKDADRFFDEIQELCELMLASVENPMEVVVKPVASNAKSSCRFFVSLAEWARVLLFKNVRVSRTIVMLFFAKNAQQQIVPVKFVNYGPKEHIRLANSFVSRIVESTFAGTVCLFLVGSNACFAHRSCAQHVNQIQHKSAQSAIVGFVAKSI
ncbi:hypothetical protein HDU79_009878 [Rhizoclosmatium sp. JEL0117]|nr:hypothetical protein HDU79_009878 [Rhizoclosmatium sp. JEL0117]